MTTAITHDARSGHDDSRERLARLEGIAARLLERCSAAGASQAEVSCSEDRGLEVNVRMGEVESVESTRDRGIAVILISHRMPDVFTVADRVIVMRRGRKVADKQIAASSPEEVTGLITGAIEQV